MYRLRVEIQANKRVFSWTEAIRRHRGSTMSQSEKLTLLADNRASNGLLAEAGFAVWLNIGDEQMLFDTGQDLLC